MIWPGDLGSFGVCGRVRTQYKCTQEHLRIYMAIVYIVFINFYCYSFFPYLSITLAAVMCNFRTRDSRGLILFYSYAHVHAHAACVYEKRTHAHTYTHT